MCQRYWQKGQIDKEFLLYAGFSSSISPLLVNAILFNNEVHLLTERLAYQYNHFDKFLIYEASTLFNGKPKPFYTEKYKDLIKDPENKIKIKKVCDLPLPISGNFIGTKNRPLNENRWIVEAAFRNQALKDLDKLPDDSIIIFQDIDEIASLNSIEQAKKSWRITLPAYTDSLLITLKEESYKLT